MLYIHIFIPKPFKIYIMKTKTLLLKFLFLTFTMLLLSCSEDNFYEEDENGELEYFDENLDAYLIDKDDIQEPDDRD